MAPTVAVVVQNQKYKIIKPIAFLSKTIESKWKENIKYPDNENIVELSSISNEAFEKFLDLGEIYVGMSEKLQGAFLKDITKYMKNGSTSSEQIGWIIELIGELTNEQLFSLMTLAEILSIDFMITVLGYKLSEMIANDEIESLIVKHT